MKFVKFCSRVLEYKILTNFHPSIKTESWHKNVLTSKKPLKRKKWTCRKAQKKPQWKMIEKQMKGDGAIISKNTPEKNGVNALPSGGIALPDDVLEKLYRSYSLKQKRSGLICFIAASILFDLWAIVIPQGQSFESLGKRC